MGNFGENFGVVEPAPRDALPLPLRLPLDLPTSLALEAATKAAAKKMAAADTECVRRLAQELFDHRTGYAAPEGKMVDGVWEPAPAQYFAGKGAHANELAKRLEQDRAEGGLNFRAKKMCASWRYCWWIAAAYLEGLQGLPGYVTRAAMKFDFSKIREEYAQEGAKAAERIARVMAEREVNGTPEAKAARAYARREAKLEGIKTHLAGLEETIKQYEKKLKRARTLLKKAKAKHKRAMKAQKEAKP